MILSPLHPKNAHLDHSSVPLRTDPQHGKAPNAWSGAQRRLGLPCHGCSLSDGHFALNNAVPIPVSFPYHSHAIGNMAVAEAYANDGSSTIYTVHLANLKVHGYAAMLQLWSCCFSNLLTRNPINHIKTLV